MKEFLFLAKQGENLKCNAGLQQCQYFFFTEKNQKYSKYENFQI
jgi:hypothetical protein